MSQSPETSTDPSSREGSNPRPAVTGFLTRDDGSSAACATCKAEMHHAGSHAQVRHATVKRTIDKFGRDIREPICGTCYQAARKRIAFDPRRMQDSRARHALMEILKHQKFEIADRTLLFVEMEVARIDESLTNTLDTLQELTKTRNGIVAFRREFLVAYAEWIAAQYHARRKEASYTISRDQLRVLVFSRDKWICRKCESPYKLSVDHIIPVLAGGTDDIENLQTLCRKCNSSKGAKHGNDQRAA